MQNFESAESYEEFKEDYWSEENIKYQKMLVGSPIYKSLEKVYKSGTIKSLDVDDFYMLAETHKMLDETSKVITDTIKEFEKSGKMFISQANFGEFYDEISGQPALFQIFPNQYGMIEINVNSAILGGKTVAEIDEIIKSVKVNKPENLQEAVVHECGHAKAYYRKSVNQIKAMNEELADKGVTGISTIAENDDVECIAEVEVLLYRGEKVPEKAMKLYKRWIK